MHRAAPCRNVPVTFTLDRTMYRLFAYPDSSDLYDVEEELLVAFERFARSWPVQGVELTNVKAPLVEGQELPDWNLGLRVRTEQLSRENVEELLFFIGDLSRTVNLPFVLGTGSAHRGPVISARLTGTFPMELPALFWRAPVRPNRSVDSDTLRQGAAQCCWKSCTGRPLAATCRSPSR